MQNHSRCTSCSVLKTVLLVYIFSFDYTRLDLSVSIFADIMVQEFVEFGPLDNFLRKEKASVTPQWKIIVAQQLARALSYLVSSNTTVFCCILH